jgi:hypothetical protein
MVSPFFKKPTPSKESLTEWAKSDSPDPLSLKILRAYQATHGRMHMHATAPGTVVYWLDSDWHILTWNGGTIDDFQRVWFVASSDPESSDPSITEAGNIIWFMTWSHTVRHHVVLLSIIKAILVDQAIPQKSTGWAHSRPGHAGWSQSPIQTR